jgi:hypothetical protein
MSEITKLREELAKRSAVAAATDSPVPEGHTRHTFDEIERIYGVLSELSARRLADGKEKKVVTLLRKFFETPHKVFKDLQHIIIKNNPVPESWDNDDSLPLIIQERRQLLFEDLKRDTYDIPTIPEHLILDESDMPMPLKGELGHRNKFGVADIQNKLGFLYPLDEDKPE